MMSRVLVFHLVFIGGISLENKERETAFQMRFTKLETTIVYLTPLYFSNEQ